MNREDVITVLESLANGIDPTTGARIPQSRGWREAPGEGLSSPPWSKDLQAWRRMQLRRSMQ